MKRVLARLVEASTAGDPMSYLLWTNKSTRSLAEQLERQGYTVSHVTVARCLRELGYSLQTNVKTIEGTQHRPVGPRSSELLGLSIRHVLIRGRHGNGLQLIHTQRGRSRRSAGCRGGDRGRAAGQGCGHPASGDCGDRCVGRTPGYEGGGVPDAAIAILSGGREYGSRDLLGGIESLTIVLLDRGLESFALCKQTAP